MDLGTQGTLSPHDGHGPVHLAFAIRREELADWERHLAAQGVAIESRVEWGTGGGTSLYFRDPDDHSVEIATPGVWATYWSKDVALRSLGFAVADFDAVRAQASFFSSRWPSAP